MRTFRGFYYNDVLSVRMTAFGRARTAAPFSIDDSTMSVLAMLLGIIAGWTLTGLHQQMKAKRVKMARAPARRRLRKPE